MTAAALAAAGVAQSAMGWRAVRRFTRTVPAPAGQRAPITVLKPLHGDEPLLEEALGSICAQDYPAFQVVFGVQDRADPALLVLERLRARFPGLDMAVVVDPTPHGLNRKVANLINMLPAARHDVLVIADSDMHVAPDYLARIADALEQPGVGLVTTLYAGLPATGRLAARLGAAGIAHSFLPGALMARDLGRHDCLGATMALTRATLGRVGGLEALADHLADDAVLGRLVRAEGMEIGLAPTVPLTTVPEADLPALLHHELRWARTIQSLAPVGFPLSALQHPLFWALLALALSGGAGWALGGFGLAWALRAGLGRAVERQLTLAPAAPIWLLPLRDVLSIAVMLASYRSRRVAWRGQVLRATRPILPTGSIGSALRPGLAPGE